MDTNLDYPAFSSFREIMTLWDHCLVEQEEINKISDLLDNQNMIIFFKKGSQIFGGPEESRLIFAKLKSNEDEEEGNSWKDEAKFIVSDLLQSVLGQNKETMFGLKDLDDIELINRDNCIEELLKRKAKNAVAI